MILEDYENSTPDERLKWLDSMKMTVGLNYFGGKSQIGKYINNHICNMAVKMKNDNRRADIFIDAFTGGGKIALSVPYGWYDTIVMNDLNYGVYSFYKYCKDDYVALIKMIDKLADVMCEDTFHLFAYLRNFGEYSDDYKNLGIGNEEKPPEEYVVNDLAAAAMTYWVTASSYNGISDPIQANYSLDIKKDINDKIVNELRNNSEKKKLIKDKQTEIKAIEKVKKRAHKRIPELHRLMHRKNIKIENLDYRELIKKYNGLPYKTLDGVERTPEKKYQNKNKLWYFDPPYHPYTLADGEDAPYNDTFTVAMSEEMIDIIAGKKEEEYGALEYFIKSDYDTQQALEKAKEYRLWYKKEYKKWEEKGKPEGEGPKKNKLFIKIINLEYGEDAWDGDEDLNTKKGTGIVSDVFKALEVEPFTKICLGGFDKGTTEEVDGERKKTEGYEYIWCRGLPSIEKK